MNNKILSNFSNIAGVVLELMEKRTKAKFPKMESFVKNVELHMNLEDRKQLAKDLTLANNLWKEYDLYDERERYMFDVLEIISALIKEAIRSL